MRIYPRSIPEVGDHYAGLQPWPRPSSKPLYRATRLADGAAVVLKSYGENPFAWRPFQTVPRHAGLIAPREVVARGAERLVVTDFVPGETLAEVLARGAVPRRRAIALVHALADALAQLHAVGIVHARVDPTHVIVGADGAEPAAHLLGIDGANARRDRDPRDIRRAPIEARGDIVAAGLLLFELLAGARPFSGEIGDLGAGRILPGPPPSLPAPLDQDAELAVVIARALAADPDDRYLSADAFRDACRALDRAQVQPPASPDLPISPLSWGFVELERFPDAPRGEVTHRARRRSDGTVVWLESVEAGIASKAPPHPSILTARELVAQGRATWRVVDAVPGDTVAALIARGLTAPRRALEIVASLADALAHLHAHGVVYRGLDPTYVIVREPQDRGPLTYVLGVDDAAHRAAPRKHGGCAGPGAVILDDYRYAAPEVLLGRPLDGASDVFFAGILLFELLTGQRPFDDAFGWQVSSAPTLPASLEPSGDLTGILQRALARSPADRFTAAELRDAAATVAARLPVALGKRAALREPRRGS